MAELVHLGAPGVDVVVDVAAGVPALVHWGAPLGDGADLGALVAALERPIVHGGLDVVAPITLVPSHGDGFPGRPGVAGRRGGGRDWAPRFALSSWTAHHDARAVDAVGVDDVAQLRLESRLALSDDGVLSARATVTNTSERRWSLDALTLTLALPGHAAELLTFSGRHTRELQQHRSPWEHGAFSVENRRGFTSHEHPSLVFAGVPGFSEWHGEVWGAHLAWSGNHTLVAERLADGRRYFQLGELLHPGEVVLEGGESYTTPELLAVHSAHGLNGTTHAFHHHARSRPSHPSRPRPVLLNTWEAVYFDHDVERLRALATTAASVGVERFVLDDGWFGERRDDTAGLGDWWVSPEVYPDGLAPLVDHVRALGMEFGLWVEPEMVNPDSDVYRAHPEWALVTPSYEPVLGRNQLVLNLAHPDVYAHVLGQLDALLRTYDIAYLKWDMNRAHAQGSGSGGAPGAHEHTLALYRMLDELHCRHAALEIESCASGGGRIDYGVLARTERVWTSDCNDALERLTIQRGVSLFVPPELMGAHIGPARAHTTGRTHTLAFRAAAALFGHLGIEWNVLALSPHELADLAEVIALHKRLRPLLHGGDAVRFDTDASIDAHGVYALDRSEAIVSVARLVTADARAPSPLRLPGLDNAAAYRVTRVALPGDAASHVGAARRQPAWLDAGITLTGRQLAAHGLQLPALHPETVVLLHLTRAPSS